GFVDHDAFAINSAMNTGVDQSWFRAGSCIDEAFRGLLPPGGQGNLSYERKLSLRDRHYPLPSCLRGLCRPLRLCGRGHPCPRWERAADQACRQEVAAIIVDLRRSRLAAQSSHQDISTPWRPPKLI